VPFGRSGRRVGLVYPDGKLPPSRQPLSRLRFELAEAIGATAVSKVPVFRGGADLVAARMGVLFGMGARPREKRSCSSTLSPAHVREAAAR
jgi:hypothetical protein